MIAEAGGRDARTAAGRGREAIDPPLAIDSLREEEVPAAGQLLARAFVENPLNRAVIPGSAARRERANRHGMRAHLPAVWPSARLLAAREYGALAGVLVAAEAGAYPFARPAWGARLRCLLGQGLGVAGRWATVYAALDERHPREPHGYLATLGVEPARWGRGLGAALLRHWLIELDRSRLPAYLETDRERSVRFYRRGGFEVRETLQILDTPVWCMARPAAGAPGVGSGIAAGRDPA